MPFCDPYEILVETRFRESLPEIDQLAEDIKAVGQLQPILVREEGGTRILIAGQRRLEACKKLGRQVWWVSQKSANGLLDTTSTLQLKRMELMENLSRCSFSPIEEAKAIREIDSLMKATHGEKKAGRYQDNENPGWNYEQTALMLGYSSKATIARAVKVAELADAVPDINDADSISEAEKMLVRAIQAAARAELAKRSQTRIVAEAIVSILDKEAPVPSITLGTWAEQKILIGKAEELIKAVPDSSITILIADPPYELDIFNRLVKGHYAAGTAKFDDKTPVDFNQLLPEFYRIMAPKSWLFVFGSLEQFLANRTRLTELGFSVLEVPLLWIKGSDLTSIQPSYNPNPFAWPSLTSEMILMAKKGDTAVIKHRHNVIAVPRLNAAEKSHASEKPQALLEYLISWIYLDLLPGKLLDPFCGSASSLIAAMQFSNLDFLGFELDPAIATIARSNLVAAKMGVDAEEEILSVQILND